MSLASATNLCSASSLAVNMTLPAFAAERRAAAPSLLGLSIDICCQHGAQKPKSPHAAAAVE